jgi:hypothetical protein
MYDRIRQLLEVPALPPAQALIAGPDQKHQEAA